MAKEKTKEYPDARIIVYDKKGKMADRFDITDVMVENATHTFDDGEMKGKYCFSIIRGVRWKVGKAYGRKKDK